MCMHAWDNGNWLNSVMIVLQLNFIPWNPLFLQWSNQVQRNAAQYPSHYSALNNTKGMIINVPLIIIANHKFQSINKMIHFLHHFIIYDDSNGHSILKYDQTIKDRLVISTSSPLKINCVHKNSTVAIIHLFLSVTKCINISIS